MVSHEAAYRIGTSGWHYAHWRGPFYPAHMKPERMLGFYAQHFDTVEINNSFYRLPQKAVLKRWAETVPKDFEFAVKASRFITHVKKLKDPHKPVATFLERVEVLDAKLGPILFQLPPGWRVNVQRLQAFLEALPEGFSYAFEFRNPSWFNETVFSLLESHGVGFCVYELGGHISPRRATGRIGYIRLHGPDEKYTGFYTKRRLIRWARLLRSWHHENRSAYCYFDNDQNAYATSDAHSLREKLGLR